MYSYRDIKKLQDWNVCLVGFLAVDFCVWQGFLMWFFFFLIN